jgi:hypothetical protein
MSFTLKGRANKKPSGSKIITSVLAIVMKILRSQNFFSACQIFNLESGSSTNQLHTIKDFASSQLCPPM